MERFDNRFTSKMDIKNNNTDHRLYNPKIRYFPFSDHNDVTITLKIKQVERGPGCCQN